MPAGEHNQLFTRAGDNIIAYPGDVAVVPYEQPDADKNVLVFLLTPAPPTAPWRLAGRQCRSLR